MRITRKQLEDNYAQSVKMNDLHYVALAETLQGKDEHYKMNGIHLVAVGLKRPCGGLVIDLTAGYPSVHYLEEFSNKMINPTGAENWVEYRTLLDTILKDRELLTRLG